MVSIKRIAGQVTLNRNYFIDVKFIAFNLESRPYWYCPCLRNLYFDGNKLNYSMTGKFTSNVHVHVSLNRLNLSLFELINQLTDNPGNIHFDKLEIAIKIMKYLLIFIRKKKWFCFHLKWPWCKLSNVFCIKVHAVQIYFGKSFPIFFQSTNSRFKVWITWIFKGGNIIKRQYIRCKVLRFIDFL